MARLTFPDEGSRLLYDPATGFLLPVNTRVYLYLDAAATQPATDLLDGTGAPVTVGYVASDAYKRLPLFSGPASGADTLYAVVGGNGPITPIYARDDDRLDGLATRVTALEADSPATAVQSVNGHTGTAVTVTKADVGLGLADNTPDATKPVSAAQAEADALAVPLTQKAAANGVATLDGGGKIPTVQLPPLAINDTFTVSSQAAMLALTAQRGDAAVRTDLSPAETFMLTTDDPTQLANWVQITTAGAVTSVFGRTGAVALALADVTGTGLAAADVGADASGAAAAVKGQPLALTGAVQPTRYVGGTTSGAPASGTFAVGDFVTTADGNVFICTVAGTPGTWKQSGSGAYAPARGRRTVLWGDSWCAINTKTTGTPDTFGGFKYYDTQGWFTWAQYWLRQRLELVNNAGITGQTSTQWLARWSTDVAPYTPDIVIIASPVINDVRNSVDLATMQTNIQAAIDLVKSIGAIPVVFTNPPLSSLSLTTAQLTLSHSYNHWLKNLATLDTPRQRGVFVIDVHPALSDATAADDVLQKSVVKYTSDGTHLGAWGAARVGKLLYNALDPIIPKLDRLPHSSASVNASVRKNLLANPGLTGTAGTKSNGATGTMPDSWTVQSSDGASFAGSVAVSLVDRVTLDPTDQVGGSWLQAQTTTAVSKVQLTQIVSASAAWAAGNTIEALVEFQCDADLASVAVFRLSLQAKQGANAATVYGVDMASDSTNGLPLVENPMRGGVFRTPPLVIPATVTSLVWTVQVNAIGTFRIARPALFLVA